jgi:hypothetical protein
VLVSGGLDHGLLSDRHAWRVKMGGLEGIGGAALESPGDGAAKKRWVWIAADRRGLLRFGAVHCGMVRKREKRGAKTAGLEMGDGGGMV